MALSFHLANWVIRSAVVVFAVIEGACILLLGDARGGAAATVAHRALACHTNSRPVKIANATDTSLETRWPMLLEKLRK